MILSVKASTFNLPLFGRGSVKKRVAFVGSLIILGMIYALHSDYNLATGSGNLCMVLFLAANVYFPAKRIRLRYSFKHVQPYFNKLLVYHIWLNTSAFVVACIHCYVSLWTNNWLLLALFFDGLADLRRIFDVDQISTRQGQKRNLYFAHPADPLFRDDFCNAQRPLRVLTAAGRFRGSEVGGRRSEVRE